MKDVVEWISTPRYSRFYLCRVAIASREGLKIVTKRVFYSTLWSEWKVSSCRERVITWCDDQGVDPWAPRRVWEEKQRQERANMEDSKS